MKAQSVEPQRVFNSYKLEVDTQKLYGFARGEGENNCTNIGGKYNGPLTLFGKVIENCENRNTLNSCLANFNSSDFRARVRGRSREDFSNSFQVRRYSGKDLSPRLAEFKAVTPKADIQNIRTFPIENCKSEDSDDLERDENAELIPIIKTDSDNSSSKNKQNSVTSNGNKQKNSIHKVIKPNHLMKCPEKEHEIKNIKPALEKYKKEKEFKKLRINSHSPTNDNNNRLKLSSSIKKKKVKGFMIRNSK